MLAEATRAAEGTAPPAASPTTSTWPSITWTSRPRPERPVTAAAPAPPPLGRAGRADPPDAAAVHAPHRPRAARHRQGAAWEPAEVLRALLAEESPAGDACHPPRPGRLPHREDVRRLGRDLSRPGAHPGRPGDPGMDRPAREPRRLRPVRDRQDLPARGPRPRRRRGRTERRLVHPGTAHRAHPPAPADNSVARAIGRILRANLIVVDDMGCSRTAPTPPKDSTAWSTPHTNAAWP